MDCRLRPVQPLFWCNRWVVVDGVAGGAARPNPGPGTTATFLDSIVNRTTIVRTALQDVASIAGLPTAIEAMDAEQRSKQVSDPPMLSRGSRESTDRSRSGALTRGVHCPSAAPSTCTAFGARRLRCDPAPPPPGGGWTGGRNNTESKTLMISMWRGGGRGIRTPVTVSRKHAFQACAFSHSATPPGGRRVGRLSALRAHYSRRKPPCKASGTGQLRSAAGARGCRGAAPAGQTGRLAAITPLSPGVDLANGCRRQLA